MLKAVQNSFAEEVAGAFYFLVSDFGYTGPTVGRTVLPVVAFSGRDVSYDVMLDTEEGVITQANVDVGKKRLVADLENLVQAAGLGARNHVPHSAQTLSSLHKTLEEQARYVRLLQPYMVSDRVVAFMRQANARVWNLPE